MFIFCQKSAFSIANLSKTRGNIEKELRYVSAISKKEKKISNKIIFFNFIFLYFYFTNKKNIKYQIDIFTLVRKIGKFSF